MANGLLPARLKLLRALKQCNAVNDCIAEYAAREPYLIAPDADGKQKFNITEEPPLDIVILLGEIVYQFRSALDHMFFDLVEINHAKGVLPTRWMKDSQFPMVTKVPDTFTGADTEPLPRKYFPETLNGLTDRAFTFVESMQPYYQRNELLFLLTKLSNIDKHRRLNTTVTRFARHVEAVTAEGYSIHSITIALESDTELNESAAADELPTPAVQVETKFVPEIALNEPEIGSPYAWPIDRVTRDMPQLMLTQLWPAFRDLIANP
jgi:hypothetical protein